MRRCWNIRRSWLWPVGLALLTTAGVCSSGCDLQHVFGSNWTFNVWIPLGLTGEPGLFNLLGTTSATGTTENNWGTDNTPPVEQLVTSTSEPPA